MELTVWWERRSIPEAGAARQLSVLWGARWGVLRGDPRGHWHGWEVRTS